MKRTGSGDLVNQADGDLENISGRTEGKGLQTTGRLRQL